MDKKYIELLLNKCIDLEKSKILFICYDIEIEGFVQKLIEQAKKIGIEEIYLDKMNPIEEHDILKKYTIEELNKGNFFERSIWDVYAKKNAPIFDTFT